MNDESQNIAYIAAGIFAFINAIISIFFSNTIDKNSRRLLLSIFSLAALASTILGFFYFLSKEKSDRANFRLTMRRFDTTISSARQEIINLDSLIRSGEVLIKSVDSSIKKEELLIEKQSILSDIVDRSSNSLMPLTVEMTYKIPMDAWIFQTAVADAIREKEAVEKNEHIEITAWAKTYLYSKKDKNKIRSITFNKTDDVKRILQKANPFPVKLIAPYELVILKGKVDSLSASNKKKISLLLNEDNITNLILTMDFENACISLYERLENVFNVKEYRHNFSAFGFVELVNNTIVNVEDIRFRECTLVELTLRSNGMKHLYCELQFNERDKKAYRKNIWAGDTYGFLPTNYYTRFIEAKDLKK
ncbi:MAG: hypothetical protein HYU70_10330 [Bacteroidetes bacterium]|nr:hypothetical protein [Bacteroidota bacterium]